jgi:hypothetical protein
MNNELKGMWKETIAEAIFKDNAAINYITFQHEKGSLPSTFTSHITLVYII